MARAWARWACAGVEALRGRVGQLAHAVPDGEAAEPELLENVGDMGGRGEFEQRVGGRTVAHAGAQVEQVVDRDPGGVPEPAQPGGAGRGDPPGFHVERRRPVQLAPPDPLHRRQRERDLDQGGGGQLGVRVDAQLVARVQIPYEQAAVQAAVVQLPRMSRSSAAVLTPPSRPPGGPGLRAEAAGDGVAQALRRCACGLPSARRRGRIPGRG